MEAKGYYFCIAMYGGGASNRGIPLITMELGAPSQNIQFRTRRIRIVIKLNPVWIVRINHNNLKPYVKENVTNTF